MVYNEKVLPACLPACLPVAHRTIAGFVSHKAGAKNRATPFICRSTTTLCVLAFLLCAGFLIHCSKPTAPAPSADRTSPKKTDPEKQEEKCQAGIGTACSKDKKCKTICDDLFSQNSHEKACLKLPKETVLGFEELFETLEEEDPDDLDLNILECLLDIDDTEFASAIKKLSKDQAKAFLIEVTEEEELSRILEEEDDAFNILKQAFSRAGLGYKLRDVLTDELEDDKSFFHIVAEDENKPAYKWIDAYVEEVCEEKRDRSQCPGEKREKLGAYCQAFINHYSSELAGFLSSANLFEDDYRKKLEREDEAWTVSGFKDFCQDKYSVSSNSGNPSSPSQNPQNTPTTPTGICDRNSLVQTAILAKILGKTQCSAVTTADLSSITGALHIPSGIPPGSSDVGTGRLGKESVMTANDFKGLSGITSLDLNNHRLHTIPSATTLLSDLTSLTTLTLTESEISCTNIKNLLKSLPNSANTLTTIGLGTIFSGGRFCYCPAGGKFIDNDLQTHLGGSAYSCTNGGEECTLTRSGANLTVSGDPGYCS